MPDPAAPQPDPAADSPAPMAGPDTAAGASASAQPTAAGDSPPAEPQGGSPAEAPGASADSSASGGTGAAAPPAGDVALPEFDSAAPTSGQAAAVGLLSDVELDVTIELGRTQMYVEDVLKLGEGSVVELDKLAGDPVDVYVNERLVARGEVLVLNDNFCVRVSEIMTPEADD